jgi:hypothetical protein
MSLYTTGFTSGYLAKEALGEIGWQGTSTPHAKTRVPGKTTQPLPRQETPGTNAYAAQQAKDKAAAARTQLKTDGGEAYAGGDPKYKEWLKKVYTGTKTDTSRSGE